MKIIFLSDTHTGHDFVNVPDGDVLVHSGDFTAMGRENEVKAFGEWLRKLPHKHKIVIAGNHDVTFERDTEKALEWLGDCIYLNNSGITIDGMKFWGSPNQPAFSNGTWAFEKTEEELEKIWDTIPEGTDVLITHGPPRSVFDKTVAGEYVGSTTLLERVRQLKPKIHVFGHIHEGGGNAEKIGETIFINAAVLNERYEMVHGATTIELT